MQILHDVFFLLHLLGLAGVVGGFLGQVSSPSPKVTAMMQHGAWTQLVSGLVLVAVAELGTEPPNHVKIGIKLALLLVAIALVLLNRKAENVPRTTFLALGAAELLAMLLAIFWH